VLPLWEKVAHAVQVGDENLVIADYGSSQGNNSMLPIRMAIEVLRRKAGLERTVEVIHTDLPSNDFSSLFRALEEAPTSYLANATNVYPSAIGRSYFEPVLPPGRVHLGWNSWTLHWMSRNPVDVPDHISGEFSASPAVRAAVAEQQAQDWRDFLVARATELRPGGKLLNLIIAKPDGRTGWQWLRDELWTTIQEFGRAGRLSEKEQLRLTMPTGQRSLADINAPFEHSGVFVGLKIVHAEIIEGPDPFWDEFQETADAEHLGQRWANMMRAVLEPTIASVLDAGRDQLGLVDDLFNRFAARIAATPKKNEHYLAAVVLSKLAN
jgi:hypothetical protein